MDTRARGKWGEDIALAYLLGKNYSSVASGFRTRFGEIDLIVSNDGFIVFVEVKQERTPILPRRENTSAEPNRIKFEQRRIYGSHLTRRGFSRVLM